MKRENIIQIVADPTLKKRFIKAGKDLGVSLSSFMRLSAIEKLKSMEDSP